MNVSDTLNKAADLIEEHGWGQGPPAMMGQSGLCAMGAIDLATSGKASGDYGAVHTCPAGQAVYRYLGDPYDIGQDCIWDWNDAVERTAAEVIEVLRAAALVEAAREEHALLTEVSR